MEDKDINKNVSTTLLNPDKWDGRYERRAGPLIKALALIATPIIPITNICLWLIKLFGLLPVLVPTIIIYIYYTWRIIAIVLLDEKERLKQFKYNLYNKYEEPENMFKIQSLYDDGCIEYVNGDGGYMVVCHNGEEIDERLKSMQIAKFLETLDDCSVDILILNDDDSNLLDSRYSSFNLFDEIETAKVFLDIVEYNKKYISKNSLVITTVFIIRNRFQYKTKLKNTIEYAMKNFTDDIYKKFYIANQSEVESILKRDSTVYFDFENIIETKYATDEYYSSKVLAYSQAAFDKAKEMINKNEENEGSFMIKDE